jgi:transposase
VTKRLEDGHFHWPAVQDGVMRLSPAQLALPEGLDWTRVQPPPTVEQLRVQFRHHLLHADAQRVAGDAEPVLAFT